jgi:hypothetical protein
MRALARQPASRAMLMHQRPRPRHPSPFGISLCGPRRDEERPSASVEVAPKLIALAELRRTRLCIATESGCESARIRAVAATHPGRAFR